MVSQGDPAVERNKATFRTMQEEVIAKGRLELVEQVMAPTFHATRMGTAGLAGVAGRPPYPSEGSGYERSVSSTAHERFIQGYRGMTSTLTDQERIIEEMQGEGDVLWARWRVRASHAREFLRRPGTGKRVEYVEVGMIRFDEDGRMVEGWFLCDEVDLAVQLGISIG